MLKDYYKILGLDKTATAEDVKKAYYELVKKYHPDKNPNNKARHKYYQITEAYSVLGDLDRRLEYSIQLFDYYHADYQLDEKDIAEIKEVTQKMLAKR